MADTLWLYRAPVGSIDGEFILLVNARGSSKCRRYDPVSGRKTHEIPNSGRPYEIVFARLISECQTLKGLPHAKVADMTKGLPVDYINELRSQVNLQPIGEGPAVARHIPTGGMLNGIDTIIDQALGLLALNYRTKVAALMLYDRPANLDGTTLVTKLYQRLETNWDGSACRSGELWRWRAIPNISALNTSPENTLEKARNGASLLVR